MHPTIPRVTHDTRNAVVAAVEDDVPDVGVWMGGRLAAKFEGRTWE